MPDAASIVPARHPPVGSPRSAAPRLLRAALIIDDDDAKNSPEPSIVGTWKEHWISEGSEGIPDGTEVDAGYAQWHSDGTEINNSGLRAPMTGNVCLGEWIKTGARTYQLNHFGISYDSTGLNLVGPARIQQWLTIDRRREFNLGKIHHRSVGRVGQSARSRGGQAHRNQSDHGNRIPES